MKIRRLTLAPRTKPLDRPVTLTPVPGEEGEPWTVLATGLTSTTAVRKVVADVLLVCWRSWRRDPWALRGWEDLFDERVVPHLKHSTAWPALKALWCVKALQKDAQVGSLLNKERGGPAWTIVLGAYQTAWIASPDGSSVSVVRWQWASHEQTTRTHAPHTH